MPLYYLVDEYPTSPPKVVIPGHLESLGLKEHVVGAIPADSEGSPILYCLIDAAHQWVSDHPLSLQPHRPVVAKRQY